MDAEDRRAQLLEVAKRLFAADGFEATTTKKIAAKAGITEALVFRHFKSKEDLYEAVIELGVARSRRPEWRASLAAAMEKKDDASFFRHLLEFIIEIHRTDPVFQRVLVHATLAGQKTALRYFHRVVDPLNETLAEYAARRQRDGAFCDGDAFGLITAVLGMGRNYAVSKYIYDLHVPDITDDEAVNLFLGIMMNGVKAKRRKASVPAKSARARRA